MRKKTLFQKLFRKESIVQERWLKNHVYELRKVWVSVADFPENLRYAWYSDDGRKVSAYYRSYAMAESQFGNFDVVENLREGGAA